MGDKIASITYQFRFQSGLTKEFAVDLLVPSMRQAPQQRTLPRWTELENHQCPNCPLKPKESPHCPVAANLSPVVDFFKDVSRFEAAEITIRSEQRQYGGTKDLQRALSGLIGLHMATSGCPILDRLRPMAFTHLPFATPAETLYRVVSMYLLAQFLRRRRGKSADWRLKGLVRLYEEISVVNKAFVRRIHSIQARDAALNALVTLDTFGAFTRFALGTKSLEKLEALFDSHLRD